MCRSCRPPDLSDLKRVRSAEGGKRAETHQMSRLTGVAFTCLVVFSAQAGELQENPLQSLSAEERFHSTLQQLQDQNKRSIRATDNEIRYLENRITESEAAAARKERELAIMGTAPISPQSRQDQQNAARIDLERERAERAQLGAELDRCDSERVELAQEQKKLLRLESEYEADPRRASELLHQLR